MNERDWIIWAAGFVDGEGCVHIARCSQTKRGSTYVNFQLTLTVAQESLSPLGRLKELFGGNVNVRTIHGKLYGVWRATNKEAEAALRKMAEFLLVKKGVAEIAIQFQEEVSRQNSFCGVGVDGRRKNSLPKEFSQAREEFYKRIMESNQRTSDTVN